MIVNRQEMAMAYAHHRGGSLPSGAADRPGEMQAMAFVLDTAARGAAAIGDLRTAMNLDRKLAAVIESTEEVA